MQMEGSVDEESTKSDEEYDDLAMQDIQENSYCTDVELESNTNISGNQHDTTTNTHTDKCKQQNLDNFWRTKSNERVSSPVSRTSSFKTGGVLSAPVSNGSQSYFPVISNPP